ncbi:hypothetical protein VT84_13840 [Gemmata sp. SH-PL17]|nr:hypothetical protein VT84_13840 [Gemmata sp. SH-PL17]
MRTRVYIAGPLTKGGLCENINRATEAFIVLAKAGFAPLCPHWSVYAKPCRPRDFVLNPITQAYEWVQSKSECVCIGTPNGNDRMTYDEWLSVDLPWVAASDALLRLPGESTGADLEESCARDHKIPVFHDIESLILHFGAKVAA